MKRNATSHQGFQAMNKHTVIVGRMQTVTIVPTCAPLHGAINHSTRRRWRHWTRPIVSPVNDAPGILISKDRFTAVRSPCGIALRFW
ncbi:hypothetical protein KCP74_05740 [Salmonella enterica subsp. enterica]|nr:hypothetical protein KCP74_05740 [Salmonella enterica subsp. enterica]